MNHSIHNVDFFLNYGELLSSSITETAIFQNDFSAKRFCFVKTVIYEPHAERRPHQRIFSYYQVQACRTPPVRGQDRVHLMRLINRNGSNEPPFRPTQADPG